MLSETEIQTIRETVPLLKEKGQDITAIFIKDYLKNTQN